MASQPPYSATYTPPAYAPPKPGDLASDPAYQFRLQQGTDALNRSAAARGVLRTGGTLKDILNYGQDFASQEMDKALERYNQSYGIQQQNAMNQYQAQKDAAEMAWQQYVYANTPRGGGGGGRGGDDIPPPPDAGDWLPDDGTGTGTAYGGDAGDPYADYGAAGGGGGRGRGRYDQGY